MQSFHHIIKITAFLFLSFSINCAVSNKKLQFETTKKIEFPNNRTVFLVIKTSLEFFDYGTFKQSRYSIEDLQKRIDGHYSGSIMEVIYINAFFEKDLPYKLDKISIEKIINRHKTNEFIKKKFGARIVNLEVHLKNTSNWDKIFPPPSKTITPVALQHMPSQPNVLVYPLAQGELIEKINLNLNYNKSNESYSELFILDDSISSYTKVHSCFDSYHSAKLSDINLSAAFLRENPRVPGDFHVVVPCKVSQDCVSGRFGNVKLPDCPLEKTIKTSNYDAFSFNSRPIELAKELQSLLKKLDKLIE